MGKKLSGICRFFNGYLGHWMNVPFVYPLASALDASCGIAVVSRPSSSVIVSRPGRQKTIWLGEEQCPFPCEV